MAGGSISMDKQVHLPGSYSFFQPDWSLEFPKSVANWRCFLQRSPPLERPKRRQLGNPEQVNQSLLNKKKENEQGDQVNK